jgi:hypothetical protein
VDLFLEISRGTLLVLHFIGLASLLGGFITQIKAISQKTAKIVAAMVHGAWTMLVTGLLLVAVAEWRIALGAAIEIDHMKVGIKSIVLTAILILVMRYRKKEAVSTAVFLAIGLLTILNVTMAVFW